jgi:hypothetical protein
VLRACGFDLQASLVPYEADEQGDALLRARLLGSPQDRLQTMLEAGSE